MLKLISLYFIVFIYIFNVSFVFLPEYVTTRILLGFLGFFSFLINQKYLNKQVFSIILLLLLIGIPSLLTTLINQYFDARFFGYILQNILLLFASYYVIKVYKLNYLSILKVVVVTVLLHNLLAVLMFQIPQVKDFISSIQHQAGNDLVSNIEEFRSRLIGVGWGSFFFGGVFGSVSLIITSFLIVREKKVYWFLIFIVLALTSVYIARITYVGILLSILYFLYVSYKKNTRLFFQLTTILIIFFIIGFYFILNNIDSLIKIPSFQHSFEIFINFYQNGSFSSSSTDVVKEMLIFPTEIKSLLIGDGIFNIANGGYYMNTDVGYSRLIYYFGIFGLMIYFLTTSYIIYFLRLRIRNQELNYLMFFLLLLLVVSNFKGLVDLNWIFFLLFWSVILFSSSQNKILKE